MDIKDRLARMSEKWGCCFQTIVRPGVYLGDVSFINAEEWKTMPLKDPNFFFCVPVALFLLSFPLTFIKISSIILTPFSTLNKKFPLTSQLKEKPSVEDMIVLVDERNFLPAAKESVLCPNSWCNSSQLHGHFYQSHSIGERNVHFDKEWNYISNSYLLHKWPLKGTPSCYHRE